MEESQLYLSEAQTEDSNAQLKHRSVKSKEYYLEFQVWYTGIQTSIKTKVSEKQGLKTTESLVINTKIHKETKAGTLHTQRHRREETKILARLERLNRQR